MQTVQLHLSYDRCVIHHGPYHLLDGVPHGAPHPADLPDDETVCEEDHTPDLSTAGE